MSDQWTTIIRPRRPWWDINLKGILEYKYLIYLFVKRDFNIVFKQTVLGPLWYIIQPLFTSGIFTMIFGAIAKLPTDGIPQPLFYFAGVSFWGYFSVVVTTTSQTFFSNSGMFNKVYYPRLVVPVSQVISKFMSFSIQLGFLALIYLAYVIGGASVRPTWAILLTPLVFALTAILALGIGLWVAGWSVKYRDLTNLLSFGVGLLMYATPVIYPLSMVSGKWKVLMYFNPMTAIMETYRYALFGQGTFDPSLITTSIAGTLLIGVIGVLIFSRAEQTAMDVV
jgi:lipopolysaccharide transport system permease protein